MLRTEVEETLPAALAAGFDFTQVDAVVSWRRRPEFTKMGRSAALALARPLEIATAAGPLEVSALKIKGVGLSDHRGEIHPPSTREYHRIHPHLGFTPDGQLVPVRSKAAPLGGITLGMARAEFEIARDLIACRCPCEVPLRLYRYAEPELLFAAEGGAPAPLGAVVSAFPTRSSLRANSLFGLGGEDGEQRRELERWAQGLGVGEGPDRELSLVREVGRRYTRTLRRFHAAGCYRYSGQPDNYAFAPERGEVFLIDLDSSRRLAECSPTEAPLQLLRDLASALYGITTYMLRRAHIQRFPPSAIRRSGLYAALLAGYYQEGGGAGPAGERVEEGLVEEVATCLTRHYGAIYPVAAQHHEERPEPEAREPAGETYEEYRRARRHQYWIYREESFSLFLAALWDLHGQSALGKRYPHRLSKAQLWERIASYTCRETSGRIRQALTAGCLARVG